MACTYQFIVDPGSCFLEVQEDPKGKIIENFNLEFLEIGDNGNTSLHLRDNDTDEYTIDVTKITTPGYATLVAAKVALKALRATCTASSGDMLAELEEIKECVCPGGTPTVTRVGGTTVVGTIAADPLRKEFILHAQTPAPNTTILYIKYGLGVSATSFTDRMFDEDIITDTYKGVITYVWSAVNAGDFLHRTEVT